MSKRNRVKRQAFFARIQAEKKRIYPYKVGTPEADLPLIDQLLLSPDIEQSVKDILREATIIDGTSVSDYYFCGTDQEYWELKKDFPNIAPPFETFLFTFKAPEYIISEKYGKRKWADNMPVEWAVLCRGTDLKVSLKQGLTDEQKTKLMQDAYKTYTNSTVLMQSVKDRFEATSEEEKTRFYDTLPENERHQLDTLKVAHGTMTAYQENRLDEFVHNALDESGVRWTMEATLFIKGLDTTDATAQSYFTIGPIMVANYSADSEGNPIGNDNRLVNEWTMDVLTVMQRETGCTQMEAGEMFRDAYINFFHTALLAISFLHCKNITLNKETYRRKSDEQLARKIPSKVRNAMPVSFHTLEITPMKEVLKTEGQSDTVGVKRALHICRGHFRHYENGRGLFGKYKGTFWIAQHVKGNIEHIALKDYNIKV